jgi:hypothetical protein
MIYQRISPIACLVLLAALGLLAGLVVSLVAAPVVVSWTEPAQNTDGTPISDLRSTVLHRRSGASWTKLTEVPPGVAAAIVSLPAGTNTIRITIYNRYGESSSTQVVAVIPVPAPPINVQVSNAE